MSGGRWGAIRGVALQIASLGTTAVLARILSTEDFGLVAIVVVVLLMFDLITRVGLGASVIRREASSRKALSTFFWASLALGLIAGLLTFLASRPAAALAGSLEAAPLVALAATTLPLNLAAKVPSALLQRSFRFKALSVIEILGAVTHALVAIPLALLGFGAWAVVAGQVGRSLVLVVASFAWSGFRPQLAFEGSVVRSELSFNAAWLGTDLVTYLNKNADYWFVGNVLGAAALGTYYVAYVIPTLLRRRITTIGQEVIYPIVSRMHDDFSRIEGAFVRLAQTISFLVLPAMMGLAAVADLAVRIGFGPDWDGAIAPLRIIAIAAAVSSMSAMASPVFPAIGLPGKMISIGLITLAALSAGLAVALLATDLTTVAYSVLFAVVIELVATFYQLRATIGLNVTAYARATAPFVIVSSVMALGVVGARSVTELGIVADTITSLTVGAMLYFGVGNLVFRSAFSEQFVAVRALIFPRSVD